MNLISNVHFIVKQFNAMGATPAQLCEEIHRLFTDKQYYNEWLDFFMRGESA